MAASVKRFGIGLLCGIGSYTVAAAASYLLVRWFSSNTHDRALEAAMTSLFFFGPIGAVPSFLFGVLRARPPKPASDLDR